MSRDPDLFLEDILAACDQIAAYVLGQTSDAFRRDRMRIDAVVRNLEIIGEATKRLSTELRENYSDVPWRQMAATRYFGVDTDLVWDITQRHAPLVRSKVGAILAAHRKRND